MLEKFPMYPSLPVVDLKRAVQFYQDTLGLKMIRENATGDVVLGAGAGTRLHLYQRAQTKADHTAISFVVDNLRSVVDELMQRGVKFEEYDQGPIKTEHGIATFGDRQAAWFKDPEGNIIGLVNLQ